MLLITSQVLEEPLDLNELLTYSLFPTPYIFPYCHGFFAKTNKGKMLHHLLETYTDTVIQMIYKFFVGMACHSLFDIRTNGFKLEKSNFLKQLLANFRLITVR